MISIFNICKVGTCRIQVSGLEKDSDQYLDEEQVSFRNYTFEQSATINIMTAIDSKQNETLETYQLVPHIDIDIDEFEIIKDGMKRIDHIIIPTKEWLDYVIERNPAALDDYSIIYFIDGDNFYKYINGSIEEVTIEEIYEVNTEVTTLIKSSLHTFPICHLEQCFYKICLYLLENMPCKDPCFTDKMKGFAGEILNRDIVWMAINTINYAIEQQQFFRAQAILEQIETCWGICKDLGTNKISSYTGCGCHS